MPCFVHVDLKYAKMGHFCAGESHVWLWREVASSLNKQENTLLVKLLQRGSSVCLCSCSLNKDATAAFGALLFSLAALKEADCTVLCWYQKERDCKKSVRLEQKWAEYPVKYRITCGGYVLINVPEVQKEFQFFLFRDLCLSCKLGL